jgi:hypothetical protein
MKGEANASEGVTNGETFPFGDLKVLFLNIVRGKIGGKLV